MKNGIMVRLANWLNEHAVCVGDSLKANVLHLWCVLISFVVITLFALLGWTGKAMEYLLMVLLLGGSVLPPIVEGIRAAITRTKWTPWYWFPIVIGNAFGCLLSILLGLFVGYGSLL